MLTTKTLILEYICPAVGVVVANIMYTAPYRDVKAAAASGRLGDLNPTPWAFMFFNCLAWMMYSILIDNLFVFFGNVIPLILAVWLNMIALELQYADFKLDEVRRNLVLVLQDTHGDEKTTARDRGEDDNNSVVSAGTPRDYAKIVWDVASLNTKAPVAHKTIILFLTVIWTTIFCILGWGRSFSPHTRELIVGVAVNVNLVFFYAAPLSTILTVLKTRSCATIHASTVYTMFANSVLWSAFGFALNDWFIALPNLLGAATGATQILFCVIYPRTVESQQGQQDASGALTLKEGSSDTEQVEFYCEANASEQIEFFMLEGLGDVEKGKGDDDASNSLAGGASTDPSLTDSDPLDEDSDKSSELGGGDGVEETTRDDVSANTTLLP